MSIWVPVILAVAGLALVAGATRSAPSSGTVAGWAAALHEERNLPVVPETIEAWAARTVREPLPFDRPWVPFTPRADSCEYLSPPRAGPLAPGNCYVPDASYGPTAWDLLVRELTGHPSVDEQALAGLFPSGQPVAL